MSFFSVSDKVISRPFYLTGIILGGLTSIGLLWSFFGELKSEVEGVGIIVRGNHLVTVFSPQGGTIKQQFKILDDNVGKGERLYSLDVSQQVIQKNTTELKSRALKPLANKSLSAGFKIENESYDDWLKAKEIYRLEKGTLKSLIAEQEAVYQRVLLLYNSKKASASELASAYGNLSQLKQQLLGYKQSIDQQKMGYFQAVQSNAQNRIGLQNDNLSLDSSLRELSLVINQSIDIKAPINGTIASVSAVAGSYVNPGDPMITLMPSEGALHAILLVGSSDVKRIKKGDSVLISPSESPAIRFGYVEGSITAIAESGATEEELIKLFGSTETAQSLLQNFSQGGATNLPILVDTEIKFTKSGNPQWTLGKQPPWGLSAGGSATARIVAQKVRPISLIFPFLGGI